jgi:hypothetical protein
MDEKKQEIIDKINELFGDTSFSQHETMDALKDIAGECETLISAIESDLQRAESEAAAADTGE